MSALLLLLAAATPDAAFEAYGKCAQSAASDYKGEKDTLEAVVGRVQTACAADQSALLDVAPDKRQAGEWIRVTTTLAVSEHVPGLPSAGDAPKDEAAAQPATVSRYPKLDAYKACTEADATAMLTAKPYAPAETIVAEAIGVCEKDLKAAVDETIAEMKQPSLRNQVTMDFRRRTTADLTQTITAQRSGGKGAGQ